MVVTFLTFLWPIIWNPARIFSGIPEERFEGQKPELRLRKIAQGMLIFWTSVVYLFDGVSF